MAPLIAFDRISNAMFLVLITRLIDMVFPQAQRDEHLSFYNRVRYLVSALDALTS